MRAATGPEPHFVGIISGFDNTPRRDPQEAVFFKDGCNFEENLRALLRYTQCCTKNPADQRIAVLNAWNEWGEGMALEPSRQYGTALLETIRRVRADSISCPGVK